MVIFNISVKLNLIQKSNRDCANIYFDAKEIYLLKLISVRFATVSLHKHFRFLTTHGIGFESERVGNHVAPATPIQFSILRMDQPFEMSAQSRARLNLNALSFSYNNSVHVIWIALIEHAFFLFGVFATTAPFQRTDIKTINKKYDFEFDMRRQSDVQV